MEQDLNTAVEGFRRRLADGAEEVERLRGAVAELDEQAGDGESAEAARSLRHARADLDRAATALDALRRDYARFRVREALGGDPGHLDDERFDDELLAMSTGRLTRAEAHGPRDGAIGFEAFRALMLSDLGLDQLVENERAERRGDVPAVEFHEDATTEAILRHWAARLQSDPAVSALLGRAAAAGARFADALAAFTRKLDNLRINYEIKQRKVDHLTFACDGGRAAIRAENLWENVEALFGDDARACLAAVYSLQQARDEVRQAREELNALLRGFLAVFVPRYITYVSRQSKARRQRVRLPRFRVRRLCAYVLGQAAGTDLLLPRGGGIEVATPRIPAHLAPFRKLKAFRDYKKALERSALSDAPTVADGSH